MVGLFIATESERMEIKFHLTFLIGNTCTEMVIPNKLVAVNAIIITIC